MVLAGNELGQDIEQLVFALARPLQTRRPTPTTKSWVDPTMIPARDAPFPPPINCHGQVVPAASRDASARAVLVERGGRHGGGLAAGAEISPARERDGGRDSEQRMGRPKLPTNNFALCTRAGHNSVHPCLPFLFFSRPALRPGIPLYCCSRLVSRCVYRGKYVCMCVALSLRLRKNHLRGF